MVAEMAEMVHNPVLNNPQKFQKFHHNHRNYHNHYCCLNMKEEKALVRQQSKTKERVNVDKEGGVFLLPLIIEVFT